MTLDNSLEFSELWFFFYLSSGGIIGNALSEVWLSMAVLNMLGNNGSTLVN